MYGGEGDKTTGEIFGAWAHMLESSTYGRITAPRNASAAVQININQPWEGKCFKTAMQQYALDKIKNEMDFDLDVYDFRAFFLPDAKDQHRALCGYYGLASNACGKAEILPLAPGAPKCNSWYFRHNKYTVAHEMAHNVVRFYLPFVCIVYACLLFCCNR